MAPSGKSRRMRPSDIRYTQKSIASRFTDGTYLSDTFEQLLNRRISVDQLDSIEVVKEKSLYWALTGNRRLYIYRKLEDLGEVSMIPVREFLLSDYGVRQRFDDRKTTTCNGKRIEMRQSEADWYFMNAIERWKASKMINRNRNEGLTMNTSRHLPTEVSSNRATSVERNDVTLDFFNVENDPDVNCCGKETCAYTAVGLFVLLFVLLAIYMTKS